MKTNVLPELTWRWLGVNEVEIPSSSSHRPYTAVCPDGPLDPALERALEEAPHGIGAEVLADNRANANFANRIVLAQGDNRTVRLPLSEESPQLVDRQQVVVPAGCSARLSFLLESEDASAGERKGTLFVQLEEDAALDLVLVQRLNDRSHAALSVVAQIADGGLLRLTQVEMGAQRSVFHYGCDLQGFEAATDVSAMYFADGDAVLDLFYNIRHMGEETQSEILVNGALADRARKSFRGTINFLEGAGGAVGDEQDYTVLLSEEAHSVAVPILLCHEDEVEGNHAASAGRIDEEQLFYLMSRGFRRKEAESLLVEARMMPTLDRLGDERLTETLREELRERMVLQ